MPTTDVPGFRLRDALDEVLAAYNREVKSRQRSRIRVIHGYRRGYLAASEPARQAGNGPDIGP